MPNVSSSCERFKRRKMTSNKSFSCYDVLEGTSAASFGTHRSTCKSREERKKKYKLIRDEREKEKKKMKMSVISFAKINEVAPHSPKWLRSSQLWLFFFFFLFAVYAIVKSKSLIVNDDISGQLPTLSGGVWG